MRALFKYLDSISHLNQQEIELLLEEIVRTKKIAKYSFIEAAGLSLLRAFFHNGSGAVVIWTGKNIDNKEKN